MNIILCLIASLAFAQKGNLTPEKAAELFESHARRIDAGEIRRVAVQNNGRVKPFDSLARETMLFLNGAYGRGGLTPVQMYLALVTEESAPFAPLIEVRSLPLREQLGGLKTQRFFSLVELENSPLQSLAEPLFAKNQENPKDLDETEKKVLETMQQYQVARMVQSGQHLEQAIDFGFLTGRHGASDGGMPQLNKPLQQNLREYLQTLAGGEGDPAPLATTLVNASRLQNAPEIMQHGMNKLDAEVFYNDAHLFMIASLLALALGFALFMPPVVRRLSDRAVIALTLLPVGLVSWALGTRIYITQFAPVVNMYTTMIWVAVGVLAFSLVLFGLYRNRSVAALMLLTSGAILLLTEKTPLVLSPDMDPIVAVLRSNYWLSTHVTTITISYAAFTIAMILGNAALVRALLYTRDEAFVREYSHYAYRMIQLGCFLLTTGIILGGIWADYSWGRFWGWDPKETWALIADLGFLAILHARYARWVNAFWLLALCPVAYLLVIMAWYGVNFILAAGLHSYGFSSGGMAMIVTFVSAQVALIAAAVLKMKLSGRLAA